jgi:fructoselysine-6-P-deglycase FrlB-like protein
MDPGLFLADLEEKPQRLAGLASALRRADPWAGLGPRTGPVLLLGMGSSHFAGQVAAARLRHAYPRSRSRPAPTCCPPSDRVGR